ncbi:MAG: hypothetical protein WAZ15_15840 [Propioniciclava sp.]
MRGLGGLAGFDELFDDDGAELVGLALGSLPLGWDGEAFFEAVTGGLVLGGDPQVADRGHQTICVVWGRGALDLGGRGGELAQLAHVDAEREGRGCHGDRLSQAQ